MTNFKMEPADIQTDSEQTGHDKIQERCGGILLLSRAYGRDESR